MREVVPPIGIEPMTRDFQSPALPTELQRQMTGSVRSLYSKRTGGAIETRGDPEQARTVDLQRDRLAF